MMERSSAMLPQQESLKCTSGRPGRGIASCRSAIAGARGRRCLRLRCKRAPTGSKRSAITPENRGTRKVRAHAAAAGFPHGPEDLLVDEHGEALRLDRAFSWEAPLGIHGLMHLTLGQAHAADRHPIDT